MYMFIYVQIVFLGIDNIHAMRDSLARLRDYVDTHGTASSDGISSFLVISATLTILKKEIYLCITNQNMVYNLINNREQYMSA